MPASCITMRLWGLSKCSIFLYLLYHYMFVNAYMCTLYFMFYIVLHNCRSCMRKWMSHKYMLYTHASTLYMSMYLYIKYSSRLFCIIKWFIFVLPLIDIFIILKGGQRLKEMALTGYFTRHCVNVDGWMDGWIDNHMGALMYIFWMCASMHYFYINWNF